MNNIASIHSKLTSNTYVEDSKHLVLDFAKQLGWSPSYFIEPSAVEKSNGYLVVEHGLQNSAIISFLKGRNEDLTSVEEENLLSLSYNNLVNWHITIDSRYVNYYFILNREKRKVETIKIEIGDEKQALSVSTFLEIVGKKPNSNIRALDDVLIENISNWKRIISAELDNKVDLVSLSHLFNATIFLRSIEDTKKRSNELSYDSKVFIEVLNTDLFQNVSQVITEVENRLHVTIPEYIVEKEKITLFDSINILDLKRFFNSFYENDYNRFRYDFSIMTKQALSRIYQKYVSLLSVSETTDQQSLFPQIPIEQINKDNGAFYTPEYIARFFAKFVCKHYTEREFNSLKILEPAVGSGIFLRTLLETQIEQRISKNIDLNIDTLFDNVVGIDIDPNACLSTNLSLTLLHYVFNSKFSKPNITVGDSLEIMQSKIQSGEKVDVIISNPPYISQDSKDKDLTIKYKSILEGLNNGKIDIYQAFLKLSIDLLSPNGLGLFVLPHNFLIAESSKKLRNYLIDNCNVELVADLSSINVFEKVSTYTMLLIFKKKDVNIKRDSTSWLLKCRTSVGEALNQLLIGNETEQRNFQIYKAENNFKHDGDWFILNKSEFDLFNKIKGNKSIDNYLRVNQGIISGCDNVFMRDINDIDKREKLIYKSFLPDKKIEKFSIEKKIDSVLFYPYINNTLITEEELINDYPNTWSYLCSKRHILESGSVDVKNGKRLWWTIHRPRKPEYVNSPKIVVPYMSITPKFALDIDGAFATSRSPYFILKDENSDSDLLYYFLGILNSIPCYWSLTLQSQKQMSGYNIFPLNTLKSTSVPDPTLFENSSLVSKLIITVKRLINEKNEMKRMNIEFEINQISCELYQLTYDEMNLLGLK